MTTTTLKIIALLLMTVDHVGAFLPDMPFALRCIGRLSACIFFFCAVEGFTHTRDKMSYLKRLYLMNLLMAAIDIFLPMAFGQNEVIGTNVFLEIFGMMLLIFLWDKFQGDRKKQIISTVLFWVYQFGVLYLMEAALKYSGEAEKTAVYALLGCSVSFGGNAQFVDLLIPIFYLCRGNKKRLAVAYSAWCGLYFFWEVLGVPSLLDPLVEPLGISFTVFGSVTHRMFRTAIQWMMIFSLPLLLCYNGKKGKGWKYLFYIYYPAHIVVLYVAGCLCG